MTDPPRAGKALQKGTTSFSQGLERRMMPPSRCPSPKAPGSGHNQREKPVERAARRVELRAPSGKTRPPRKAARKTSRNNYAASQAELISSSESSNDESDQEQEPETGCESCTWKLKCIKLVAAKEKLSKKLKETKVQRNRLMKSLTSKLLNDPTTFTTEEGFPEIEQLEAMAHVARKPYCFVRTMMQELWPNGFGNKTVSGQPTRNGNGRPSRSSRPSSRRAPRKVDGALESNKVKYVKDRLVEYLVLLGNDIVTSAEIMLSNCGKWMSQVICLYNKKNCW